MKRETEEWIKIAAEDLKAEYLIEKSLFRMVCYHAQQTVEKVLKAVLTEHEIEFSQTHNILDLSNAVKKAGHDLPLTDEDANKALNIAHKIMAWLKKPWHDKGEEDPITWLQGRSAKSKT